MRTTLISVTAIIVFSAFLSACAQYPEPTVGMNEQEMTAAVGQPEAKWSGSNGIEFWKYNDYETIFVILQNGKAIKTVISASRRQNFSNLVLGLPEAAVIEMLGKPVQIAENKDGKNLSYIIKAGRFRRFHFVRIVNGVVESYGIENHRKN